MKIFKLSKTDSKNLLRVVLFALLGAMPWWGITPLTMFVMFVPLLMIQRDLKGVGVVKWWILGFIIYNLASVWWVAKATIIGPLAATFVYTTLFGVVVSLYNKIWRKATLSLSYTFFVTAWIAAEWFYTHNNEISFPWLNLGNGFGITPSFVQWYEYSGVFGGSLWVLIVNLLIFEGVKELEKLNFRSILSSKKVKVTVAIIVIPLIFSVVRYHTYTLEGKKSEVVILQPNVDPYEEKFGSMTPKEQVERLIDLASSMADDNTDFIIAPETAIDSDIWLHTIESSMPIEVIRNFLAENGLDATFISGGVVREYYSKNKYSEAPTVTARTSENISFYYDTYNSALAIDKDSIEVYNKSRLTIGVEMMPLYKYTKLLGNIFVDLGGYIGMYGSQKEREVFVNRESGVVAGTAICYESVYGDFFTQFVKRGAEVMFVITNDGWWGDTPGYHQHLSFSSLRAIENRREIARSANTGISAHIDSRGKILEHTEWDEATALKVELTCNDEITFYAKYGDFIGRLSAYIFALTLLYFVAYSYKKRDHLI